MRIRIFMGRASRPRDSRLNCLIKVLMAARRDPEREPALRSAGFGSDEAIREIDSFGEALGKIAPSGRSPSQSGRRILRFRPRFECPRGLQPRTALFHSHMRPGSSTRLFSPRELRVLPRFRPEALAGPSWLLADYAEKIESGVLPPLALRQYVTVFCGRADGALAGDERDRLWRVFGVPVFEQLLGFDGSVAASECEAHDGLHVREDHAVLELDRGEILLTSLVDLETPTVRVRTGLAADVLLTPCGCGAPGVRLARLRPFAGLEYAAAPLRAQAACA